MISHVAAATALVLAVGDSSSRSRLSSSPRVLGYVTSDTVRGRVTDREKHPLARVDVGVNDERGAILESTQTGDDGRYSIVVREPRDAYVLTFRRVGYVAFSRTIRRAGLSSTIEVDDVQLAQRLDVLEPMVVRSAVLVPLRGAAPTVGGTERNANSGAEFTTDPSDLTGLIGRLPGVQTMGDSGFSVLGAGPNQNRITVDGADFGGSSIPRDAIQRTKLITNTFDPSRGRFAGGEAAVTTRRGGPEFESLVRGQLLHPRLAWADPHSPVVVPVLGSVSGFFSGPLHWDALNYFAAVDLSHRTTESTSLLEPRDAVLSGLGLSPDTVGAVARTVEALGAPLSVGGSSARTTTLRGSASVRADFRQSSTTSYTLSSLLNWSHTPRTPVGSLSFPSTGSTTDATSVRVLFNGGTYVAGRILDEFRVSAGRSTFRSAPLAALSSGSVRVATSSEDGRTGSNVLRFGGSGSGVGHLTNHLFAVTNEMSWVTGDSRHQLKLTQEALVERRRTSDASNAYGSVVFSSLADLAANHPSAYRRQLLFPEQSSRALTLGGSIGDTWHAITGRLDLQGGVRFDATRFAPRPPLNSDAASIFGVRTDRLPTNLDISPRLGFMLRLGPSRTTPLIPPGTTTLGSNFVRAGLVPIDAAGVAIPADPEDVMLMGGVGAFRGTMPLWRVGALTRATGLFSTAGTLYCIGEATPIPQWSGPGSEPASACLDGAPSEYVDDDPRVAVLGGGFRAPVSWRANIALQGFQIAGLSIAPEFSYVLGRNVESALDLNLRDSAAFTLADEAGRPVFAPVAAIHPGTGLIGQTAARKHDAFGPVIESLADLRYRTAQLTIAVAPQQTIPGGGRVFGVYSWTPQRFQQRGYGGTTSGDPRGIAWVRGSQPVHQMIVGATNLGVGWLRVATRVTMASGVAFTPLVAQDINGDGLANDRAFIPDPARSADTSLAIELRSVLGSMSGSIRHCLQRSFSKIAGPASCRSGWSARLDLAVNATPPGGFAFGNRVRITATLLNASSAFVRLFHLENSPFGRATSGAPIDPRLLHVTGFDSSARRYRYRVNQQFGEPLVNGTGGGLAPFELQLGVEVRLGYSRRMAGLPRVARSSSGEAPRTNAARVRADLVRRFVGPSPIARLLDARDSLGLSGEQLSGINAVETDYLARRDSLLAPVVAFAIARGSRLTIDQLRSRMQDLAPSMRELGTSSRQRALSFLTLAQRRQLEAIEQR
jgi:hypothetical protein